ncbi:MAG: tRNA (N(6)-L-threonylcarbamoyladenosine(37)-C(2))-methylthiotransferase [Candidatus Woesearchaeota archaeon]
MKIYIENYGCTANKNNAEIIRGILSKKHKLVKSEEDADVVIINSCVVKGPTENRIAKRISDIKKPLVVAGCMVDARKELIKKIRPDASLVSVRKISDIERAVSLLSNDKIKIEDAKKEIKKKNEIKIVLPKKSFSKKIEILQIAEGCLGNCTYCITKIAKGKLFSYPERKIIDAIKKSRAKEIWITSQDCGAYGRDKGTNLVNLLKKVLRATEKKKNFQIRIGMMNPNFVKEMINELIRIYKNDKIKKFLHIPLQSGSNEILKKMNRKYSAEDFIRIVKKFRKNFSDIHIKTDVIVGFPGETEKDFEDTLKVIKETKPNSLNISRFWPRPKTEAKKMKQLPDYIIMQRSKKIKELFSELKNKNIK